MANSDTAICNIALRMLRDQPITSLTDTSNRAQTIATIYPDARDWCLAAHPWNFAMHRAANLSRNADAPAFGFDYAYALPADPYCLRVYRVNDGRSRFKVEGRDLLTDDAEVDLLYIKRVTDVSVYAPGFVQSFALYLAAQLAVPLTGSETKAESLMKKWERMFAMGRMMDGIEDIQDDAAVSPFVAIRQ